MSASDSSSSWSSLVLDLQPQEITFVPDERDFHRQFQRLCTQLRERQPQRLLAKFLRQHAQVIAFIGGIDESAGLEESHSLSALFWSVAFAIVRVRRLAAGCL
jgi:hypothetical protein